MRKCGAEHGYNFNSHARQFQKSDFKKFETIVVMDNENYRAITSMAPDNTSKAKVEMIAQYISNHKNVDVVPDPYYGGDKGFELVIELLEDACEGIIDTLS